MWGQNATKEMANMCENVQFCERKSGIHEVHKTSAIIAHVNGAQTDVTKTQTKTQTKTFQVLKHISTNQESTFLC